jgi:hypothetical protein
MAARTEAAQRERQARFKRVAARRANRILGDIEMLIRTANPHQYSYTEEQANEVIAKLQQGVDQLAAAYSGGRGEKLQVAL